MGGRPLSIGSDMNYDRQILELLSQVGDSGMSVRIISKHLYNMNCSLFAIPDLEEISRHVRQYLLRNSKSPQSLIEHTGRRGVYRLNTANSAVARQLLLKFSENMAAGEEEPDDNPVPHEDRSLSLFD